MFYNIIMEQILAFKTIEKEVIVEQEINKSKFISYLCPVQSEDEAKEYLKQIKKMHPKATHHCSAYRVGEIERSNDDGEPASSAGLPMLQVLKGHDLDNVIAVVVRYYGGVKLGVGGLIRAYGGSVTLAIESSVILVPQWMHTVQLIFPYEYINTIETHCEGLAEIVNRQYDSNVYYTVKTQNPEQLEELNDLTRGTINMVELEKEIDYVKED